MLSVGRQHAVGAVVAVVLHHPAAVGVVGPQGPFGAPTALGRVVVVVVAVGVRPLPRRAGGAQFVAVAAGSS